MKKSDKNKSLTPEMVALARSIMEAAGGASWLTDRCGRVLACNRSAGKISGEKIPLLEGPQIQIDPAELVSAADLEGKAIELTGLELDFSYDQGQPMSVLRVCPIELPAGWARVFWVHISGYRQPEELAIQSATHDKLQGMTGLAAKIAHELNNPLDGSMRYINLALRRLNHEDEATQSPQKVTEYLSSAQEALGKINTILSDLAQFARSGQSEIETISINDLVEQAVRTLSARATLAGVSIVTMLSNQLPTTGGQNLYQVFCNLLKNAVDAVEEKRSRDRESSGGMVTIRTRRTSETVCVIFEDTGVGLPEERGYLFDPFFTTKPAGKGAGLGLAISREIVEEYGGTITADNDKRGGARFIVELPLINEVKKQGAKTNDS